MDEYDYLEAQLEEGKPAEGPPASAPPPAPETSNGRERSKERSRDRKSSRDRDGRDRDTDRSSRGDRDRRDKDRSSRRSRSRSRSRDRRRRSPSRDRDRDYRGDRGDRSDRGGGYDRRGGYGGDFQSGRGRWNNNYRGGGRHDGYRNGGGYDRGRDRDRQQGHEKRDRTPPEVRLQREKEQELSAMERTVRTVMVMNLNLKASWEDILTFFSNVGDVNDVKLIKDKHTGKSKGIAYIEFATVEAAMSAITLNGQVMMNMPIYVKPSEAEKNLAWEAQEQAKKNQAASMSLITKLGGPGPGMPLNPIKLQILNLHPGVLEDDLKALFEPFGEINYVSVQRDTSGNSTGEAFVQYVDASMADKAIKHFNGFEILGKKLSVQVAPLFTLNQFPVPQPMTLPSALPGAFPAAPTYALPTAAQPLQPPAAVADVLASAVGEVDDLDESENKSFKLNAQSRAALMSRLATSAGLQAPPSFLNANSAAPAAPAAPVLNVSQQVLLEQGLLGPASPIPTPCVLLKNMFSDADKAEATWQNDVMEDVRSEASKFGEVLHCHVDPNSKGHVYLKFAAQQSAEAAYRALHGRYYSGNQIVASYQFLVPYNNYFGQR